MLVSFTWHTTELLNAVAKAVPAVSGILIQFPLYGSIAFIMTQALNSQDLSLSHYIAEFSFQSLQKKPCNCDGNLLCSTWIFVPSGGGKWIIEAPYVMQAANDLKGSFWLVCTNL